MSQKKNSKRDVMERFTGDSTLTEKDALELGAKVNKRLARRLSRKRAGNQ